MAPTHRAFAAVCCGGEKVVMWRHAATRPSVQDQLRKFRQPEATNFAFAPILEDESVVTWGKPEYGLSHSAHSFT